MDERPRTPYEHSGWPNMSDYPGSYADVDRLDEVDTTLVIPTVPAYPEDDWRKYLNGLVEENPPGRFEVKSEGWENEPVYEGPGYTTNVTAENQEFPIRGELTIEGVLREHFQEVREVVNRTFREHMERTMAFAHDDTQPIGNIFRKRVLPTTSFHGDFANRLRAEQTQEAIRRMRNMDMDQTEVLPRVPAFEKEVLSGDNHANYIQTAIDRVREVANASLLDLDEEPEYDVYVVWFCKTLKNWKAMVGTSLNDENYYEVTYDGDKRLTYVDVYDKIDQSVFYD